MTRSTLLLAVALYWGCAEETTPLEVSHASGASDQLELISPDKADNYYSPWGKEYTVTGRTTLRIEAEYAGRSDEERLARARTLVTYRQTVVAFFLNEYLVEKDETDRNQYYGSFNALTKNGSWEDLGLEAVDELTYALDFRQELTGPHGLLGKLPIRYDAQGRVYLDLRMGRIGTAEMQELEIGREWFAQDPWRTFNPRRVPADAQEEIRLYIEAQTRSSDTWLDYGQLLADGVIDIGVHLGYDYHKAYHIDHARSVYNFLDYEGFESPVQSFEWLRRDSGPMVKTIETPVGPAQLRVSLFWGQPYTDTDPDTQAGAARLRHDMLYSLAKREVIIYGGHGGSFHGFLMGNWHRTAAGTIDDTELAEIELPEHYQVVLAEACDTYAIGQGFYLNPAKAARDNLDVITTTRYTDAAQAGSIEDFLAAFTRLDHGAPRLSETLLDMSDESGWAVPAYGVHGVDANPRRHPFASVDLLGAACSFDGDCGGEGNYCLRRGFGGVCTFECTADDGCGADGLCQGAARNGFYEVKVCAPKPKPKARIRFATAVPVPDSDLNGDGVFDASDDEAVTIVNRGDAPADLSGWALGDFMGARFTFPAGFTLGPGEEVTIYGSGGTLSGALRLSDRVERLSLIDARGGEIDTLRWFYPSPGEVLYGDDDA